MKTTNIVIIILLFVSVIGCSTKDSSQHSVDNQKDTVVASRLCYLLLEKYEPLVMDGNTPIIMNDSTYLTINLKGQEVEGMFNIIPAERDAAYGTYTGQLDSLGRITGRYTYTQEGDAYTDIIQINLSLGMARMRFVADTTVSADSEEAGDWFELPEVPCFIESAIFQSHHIVSDLSPQ